MSSSLQLFSSGLVRSQSSPSTLEITVRSSSDLEMPLAMAAGVVSHEVAFSSFPLGSETVISSRGLANAISACWGLNVGGFRFGLLSPTSNLLVLSSLDLVENIETVLDEFWKTW